MQRSHKTYCISGNAGKIRRTQAGAKVLRRIGAALVGAGLILLGTEVAKGCETAFSEGEIDMISACVWSESGNQGYEGQRAVAAVILNRIEDEAFPDTVEEVLTQKNQFYISPYAAPTEETLQAVIDEINDRTDTEILFFRTKKYHSFGTPAYRLGDHYFSTK